MPVVTRTPLTLAYVIPDITDVLLTFDRLVWLRSRTGPDGIYDPATAPALAPAVLKGTSLGPHALSGKTMSFRVNGVTQVDVLFAGADPYTTTAAAADINLATPLVIASVSSDDRLVLTTVALGSGASIEILSSEGAISVGYQTGDASIGVDLNLVLAGGTYQYFYTDQNSSSDFWYKVRYLNSLSLVMSELSTPFTADNAQVVPYSETAVGFVRLCDLRGRALSDRSITIANMFLPNTVAGYNSFRHFETIVTDKTGYVEIRLLKGAELDVAVEGTNFVRRIKVPSNVDVFNLFDPSLVTVDEFGIQQPNIDFAIRLS